jgi:pimeloyl-ACP methyl ester carboxylesterase
VRSDLPTLFVVGSFDALTPAAWTLQVADGFSDATQIVFPEVGHGIGITQNPGCFGRVASSFLDDPGTVDATCVQATRDPTFATG